MEVVQPEDSFEPGIPAGSVFGWGEDMPLQELWQKVDGNLKLSEDGEQFFLYCEAASGDPHFLAALGYTGTFQWDQPGLEIYGPDQSALPVTEPFVQPPDGLLEYNILLPLFRNHVYNGPRAEDATEKELKEAVLNVTNWLGSDNGRFEITPDETEAPTPSSSSNQSVIFAMIAAIATSIWASC